MPITVSRTRRALFPLLERDFTYARYDRLLERLASGRFRVVPLHELTRTDATGVPVVALRHDVDERLDSALELGRLEHARGLRSTYFVLHTAGYWTETGFLDALRTLQDYGHEIGWHNDLVTLQCVYGADPRAYLERELARLREAGIVIRGVSSHGSPYCYRFGYHNNYFFSDFDGEVLPGFPNAAVVETPLGRCEITQVALADFGFEYEAYHLDNDLYFSDASFPNGGRWHPDELDFDQISPGRKAIILVHPCHWDASVPAKFRRLAGLLAAGRWRSPDTLP